MTQKQSWQEWLKAIHDTSAGRINYLEPMLSEEVAETDHPALYDLYQSGITAEGFVAEHLVVYEEQGTVGFIDPDDSGDIPDQEYP